MTFKFEHQQIAEEILWCEYSPLSDQEVSFLESLIDNSYPLSPKQRRWLENIREQYDGASEIMRQVSRHP